MLLLVLFCSFLSEMSCPSVSVAILDSWELKLFFFPIKQCVLIIVSIFFSCLHYSVSIFSQSLMAKVLFAISLVFIPPLQKAPHGIYVLSLNFFIMLFSFSLFSTSFHFVSQVSVQLGDLNIQKAKQGCFVFFPTKPIYSLFLVLLFTYCGLLTHDSGNGTLWVDSFVFSFQQKDSHAFSMTFNLLRLLVKACLLIGYFGRRHKFYVSTEIKRSELFKVIIFHKQHL